MAEAESSQIDAKAIEKQENVFCVVFIGDVGVGKSSLIKSLCHPEEKKIPATGRSGEGVTKEFTTYRLRDQTDRQKRVTYKMYGVDCVGVGDHSCKMTGIIAGLEKLAFPIHAICILNAVPTGRVGLAAQVAGKIINLGMVEHGDTSVANRTVIVGTKADMCDEEDDRDWRNGVAPHFERCLGFEPKHVVTTGINVKNRKTKKTRVSELLQTLLKIGNERQLKMQEVNANKFVTFLQDVAGFDIQSPEQVQELVEELQKQRDEAQKKFAAAEKQWKKTMEQLKTVKEENIANRRKASQLESKIEEQKKTQAALEKKIVESRAAWAKLQIESHAKYEKALEERRVQFEAQFNKLTSSNADLAQALEDRQTQYNELTSSNAHLAQALEDRQTEYNELTSSNADLVRKFTEQRKIMTEASKYQDKSLVISNCNETINGVYVFEKYDDTFRPSFKSAKTLSNSKFIRIFFQKESETATEGWVIGVDDKHCLAWVKNSAAHPMYVGTQKWLLWNDSKGWITDKKGLTLEIYDSNKHESSFLKTFGKTVAVAGSAGAGFLLGGPIGALAGAAIAGGAAVAT